jgi:aspartate-semialdehyde dehydrogenase
MIKAGILGATGTVGQRLVQLLVAHPYFEIVDLIASERSAGGVYRDVCRWMVSPDIPPAVAGMRVKGLAERTEAAVLFSGLPSDVAKECEPAYAAAGHVVSSNASSYRMAPDVPLIIPEINPDHVAAIACQQRARGWRGMIVTNPNCTTIGMALSLKPLDDAFGVTRVSMVSMQALSGAGYPGVPSLDALDNVVPYIGGEEEKVQSETQKVLGAFCDGAFQPSPMRVSAHCNRVPAIDGHLECVSVELADRSAALDDLRAALESFRGLPQELGLPTAPERPIVVRDEPDRPQTRRDRETGNGMSAVVGRLRPCPVLDFKYVVLSHNTIRGAAGAAVLNAELLHARGYVG